MEIESVQKLRAAGRDKRCDFRRRTLRRARVIVNNSNSSFDAVIRDLSMSGARVKLPSLWAVPDAFELQILTSLGAVEMIVPCEKRWQVGDTLGARFVSVENR
ncbi:hypothetical protein L53_12745 [Hyphomonas sp. L-53-1-40]|uniref:PilZ domain-containing protein n=1 Tax=Hyphomonas sp. L-53-1-40 TaxID=1207058 RepID=UPI000458DF30|nr:PilZ domain-containing protein [Hyphomonas sp. L-53-1-40]KCZ62109.1 hypothetical protein L53_12745 [Hyphomonas sp. L-53-1-40]